MLTEKGFYASLRVVDLKRLVLIRLLSIHYNTAMYTCGFHVHSYQPLGNTIARFSQPARGNPRTPRDPTYLLFMYLSDDFEWVRDCVAAVLYF